MGHVEHFGGDEQFVATETVGFLPVIAVLVNLHEHDVVHRAILGVVFPNNRFDVCEPHLVGRSLLVV